MRAPRPILATVAAVLAAGALTACNTPEAAAACPTGAPGTATAPDWTHPGQTGSIVVTGSTDTASPQIAVEKPFSVAQTQVQAFDPPGDGAVVAETARVSVCYLGVNGRTGERFDSTYDDGKPASFPLDGVIPGFKKAIAGQKVGSSVGVAVAPEDGYPTGTPDGRIQAGDTIVFAIKILSAS
ncbi:peptidyl-prolyl cis-trans isomerase [Tsukamurella pulmonis]|uniref:FKBP-type peptidyl-prolyl cis-trans isomerase n=1 Tax=Tsukamurella pulmonis TaxID=47312 RepID=UPI0007924CCC|nr:FKBP-type peptidyl-prolyl cis-trans isomerase [Tsukamurella pulmonis]KXP13602.1 peptidylprolyl isomerase [Tsukamurella pulmonis]BDD82024.1 peptidyl-prolyl cis-trans isomerase [Tsukamurella pulmonis]